MLNRLCLFVLMVMLTGGLLASEPVVAFVHANVIPMEKEHVLTDQTVIIKNGRIVEIGPSASIKPPDGATAIDAKGKFLIPALSDMHMHLEAKGIFAAMAPGLEITDKDMDFHRLLYPYLANGVTLVQVMSALPEHVPLRDKIKKGELLAPRLVLSPMMDNDPSAWPPPMVAARVKTATAARQAVIDFKKAGFHRVKVYSFLSEECYRAIVSTAKELGMKVDGHIPQSMSVEQVIEAGQTTIAHSEEIMKFAKGKYTTERIAYFSKLLAKSGTWVTPTLITSRKIIANFGNLTEELKRPEITYVHPIIQGWWSPEHNLYKPLPPAIQTNIREGFTFQLQLTKGMHDAGVNLMAGTDTFLPLLVPGFSIHEELAELVGVGLTPYQALRTSTTTPHIYLDEAKDYGTVEKGKIADLVLLEKNPLENIANTKTITGVMVHGQWLSQSTLKKGLDNVALFNKTWKR